MICTIDIFFSSNVRTLFVISMNEIININNARTYT